MQYLDGEKEEPDKVKQWQGGVGRAAANPGELVVQVQVQVQVQV